MDAPVIVERNLPHPLNSKQKAPNIERNHDETGFPFDDSDFEERERSRSFRDTLDDIAKRHPEFAQHLNFDNKFPFRSNTWGHKRRGSGEETKPRRFAEFTEHFDRPSSSRFKEKFGFPFGDGEFESERFPEPQQSAAKDSIPEETAKPPQVPTERGRKQNPHIAQSNTVDLGQKQEPVCDSRGQRSMSAPPENRAGQRFVSSINIPMNTEAGNEAQPHQQPKSNERVIPIHVEGRNEPVMPKNPNQTFSQPPPQAERSFGQKPNFGQWKRNEMPYYTGDTFSSEPHYEGRQFFTGQPGHHPNTQQTTFHKPQTPPPAQQKSGTPPPQPQAQQQQPPQPQAQQQQPPPQKTGPISQIQCIQRDVLELMGQVEQFNGLPRDKQYLYLDEMLTRNLLKLDNIETEGKENIRHARKEAIHCIQKCISILEAKALANEQLRNAMEVDTKPSEEAPLTTLEVSGISRSGSENLSSSQQDQPEAAPVETVQTEVSSETAENETEATGTETKVEENPATTDEINQAVDENVESSQEIPKVTKDKKKIKKKEKTTENA